MIGECGDSVLGGKGPPLASNSGFGLCGLWYGGDIGGLRSAPEDLVFSLGKAGRLSDRFEDFGILRMGLVGIDWSAAYSLPRKLACLSQQQLSDERTNFSAANWF